jgi:hypothetical protein
LEQEWTDRANGKKSSSSSSSIPVGSFSYQDYSSGSLGKGQQSILFFYASWSMRCRANDTLLSTLVQESKFIQPVFKVNYDTETVLRTQYNVTHENTFILLDANGVALEKLESPHEATVHFHVLGY